MSFALSDLYSPPSIEQIDAALDHFNDAMLPLGYEATHQSLRWGEGKITVTAQDGDITVAEFYSGTPGFLADFERYAERTIDAMSIPRAEMVTHGEPAVGSTRFFPAAAPHDSVVMDLAALQADLMEDAIHHIEPTA